MNEHVRIVQTLALGALVSWSASVYAQPVPDLQPPAELHPFVAVIEARLADGDQGVAGDVAGLLYRYNGHAPQWTVATGPAAAMVFLHRMMRADADGLCLAIDETDALLREISAHRTPPALHVEADGYDRVLDLDIRLTLAIAGYVLELHAGGHARREPPADARLELVARTLAFARDRESAGWALARLEPPHPEYRGLRRALAHYRALAANGGWDPVPDGVVLRPEDDENGESPTLSTREREAVRAIVQRLRTTGELPAEAYLREPPVYDSVLGEAVRRFQARHGLQVDGIVGPETLEAMNVPVERRVEIIELNMDRWRRVPAHDGRHVRVNIPDFRLWAMRGHDVDLDMRVVVGTTATQTPVFGDEISYLEFSPDWNVPDRIARTQVIPRVIRDRGYLDRMDFEIVDGWGANERVVDPGTVDWSTARTDFPYRLRQRPGSENAMGLVKFMFPNEYLVYLHDTPAVHRFEARRRTFSNGCVRVAKPELLAEWLLDDPGWGPEAVERAMHAGEQQVVPLREHLPVELRYLTAWLDAEGQVQFRPDVYGRDRDALERHDCVRRDS